MIAPKHLHDSHVPQNSRYVVLMLRAYYVLQYVLAVYRTHGVHVSIHTGGRSQVASRSAIQGDMGGNLISLGGDSIGHCEKKSLCGHVSNSELLQR